MAYEVVVVVVFSDVVVVVVVFSDVVVVALMPVPVLIFQTFCI